MIKVFKKALSYLAATLLVVVVVGVCWLWVGASLDDDDVVARNLIPIPKVADSDNGFLVISYMDDHDYKYFESGDSTDELNGLLGTRWDPDVAKRYVETYKSHTSEVERILSKPRYKTYSEDPFRTPSFDNHLNNLRLTIVASRLAASESKFDVAVDDAVLAIRLTEKMKQDESSSLISFMIALAAQHYSLNWIHRLSVNYPLEEKHYQALAKSVGEVSGLGSDGFPKIFSGEFAFFKTIILGITDAPIGERFRSNVLNEGEMQYFLTKDSYGLITKLAFSLQPQYFIHKNKILSQMLKEYERLQDLSTGECGRTTLIANSTENPKADIKAFLPNGMGADWVRESANFTEYFERRCMHEFYRQAVATIIAIRTYEIQHHTLPQSLDALAPQYLPELPTDPFGDGLLGYNRETGWLYSQGLNLTDNGGSTAEYHRRCHVDDDCRDNPTVPITISLNDAMMENY